MKQTVESKYRLMKWSTLGKGDNAEWIYQGAVDGKNHYEKYKDDYAKLRYSYDYEWIKKQFKSLYPEQTLD